ncbi:GNAT family N-acetyltransferase [Actinoplanes derwentensis]|uniref:GNAT family N-acetyltransferase n=1 Tax=Actinoplanes derwentensis TaxID=113562 RepID=UPI0012FE1B27|nr:GNAT family N-acetyltransferase [Actinoplanes derwentensis]
MSIRTASDEDVRELVEDRHDRHHFLEHLGNQRGILLFALRGEALIGHVFLRTGPAEEPELRDGLPRVPLLQHLKVTAEHRGRGIAQRLLAEAENRLRALQHRRVALGVHPDNQRAIRLYRWTGFAAWRDEPIITDRIDVAEDGTTVRTAELCLVFVKSLG